MTFAPITLSGEARAGETVLQVARKVGAPLGNACDAIGICGRCVVRPVAGAANLTEPTARERLTSRLGSEERLACQSVVLGDCIVTTTYWGK